MNCPRCGTPMSGGVCPECGFPVTGIKVMYSPNIQVMRVLCEGSFLLQSDPLIALILLAGVIQCNYHKEYGRDKPDERTATCGPARC